MPTRVSLNIIAGVEPKCDVLTCIDAASVVDRPLLYLWEEPVPIAKRSAYIVQDDSVLSTIRDVVVHTHRCVTVVDFGHGRVAHMQKVVEIQG